MVHLNSTKNGQKFAAQSALSPTCKDFYVPSFLLLFLGEKTCFHLKEISHCVGMGNMGRSEDGDELEEVWEEDCCSMLFTVAGALFSSCCLLVLVSRTGVGN